MRRTPKLRESRRACSVSRFGMVVHGASDDLIEFRGAIRDEGDCYDGGTVLFDAKGVLPSWDSASECEESAQEYFERKAKARTIEALFAKEGDYTWTYKTDIPHETFEIVEYDHVAPLLVVLLQKVEHFNHARAFHRIATS